MYFNGRHVLILGGIGFIGSNLAARMVSEGAHVTLVDSMLPNYGGNLENIAHIKHDVSVNFSDIRDRFSLDYLVRDADVIYSVAGQTSHIDSMTDPITDLDINCRSQLSLLECCKAHNSSAVIVYASTRQIYGRPKYLPVDEKHPIIPVDINGINKLAAEHYYTLYSKFYGMKCVSLRLTNTYGPRQQLRGNTQGFVGVFVRKALAGENIQIFGDGKQIRDFNYIDDVVEAFMLAAENDTLYGGSYNLGNNQHYSLSEFTRLLANHCQFDIEYIPFPSDHQKIDIGDYYADYSRFQAVTGWSPSVDLDEGLRRTIEYYRPRTEFYC